MILSILVCSLEEKRKFFRERLNDILNFQITEGVEVLWEIDNGELSIGAKRNNLLQRAVGEYICFMDDDDRPSWDYIEKAMKALESKPDCCSLNGVITENGLKPKLFVHSLAYDRYYDEVINGKMVYFRFPNHLNIIKSSIAKQFRFPETNHGEDTDFATQIHKSGLIKTQAEIEGIIYNYDYIPNK